MKRFSPLILILLVYLSGCRVGTALADEVVMTTGERFATNKVWAEGDKIRFNMQGLVVSVDKAEVAAIIHGDSLPASHGLPAVSAGDQQKIKPTAPPAPSGDTYVADPTVRPLPKPAQRQDPTSRNFPPISRKGEAKGTGMDGITWRMAPKQLPGLKKIETDPAFGGIDQYYLPDQPLQFAGAPLDGLVYGFWQGQLYSVMMWVDGRVGYDRLRRGIFSSYGQGVQRRPEVERYVWDEAATQRMLEFDDKLKTGIFIMRSSEVDTMIKEHYPDSASR